MNLLALIPARGSSKSIIFKNLIKIKGFTLIEKNFFAIKKSRITKHIYCSTENIKIKKHCGKIGLNVINRPKSLSKDSTNIFHVAKHALEYLKFKEKIVFDYVILLQPTYPFINYNDILNSINKLKKNPKFTSCQTIHSTPHAYHYLNTRIIKNNSVKFKYSLERMKKFNKQKKNYTYNFGNLVITKVYSLLKEKTFFTKKSTFIKIDRYRSFDLDDKNDLEFLKKIN